MSIPEVRRELWRQGEWVIEYRNKCPRECLRGGPSVLVTHERIYVRRCWHQWRFFSHNRTLMECLCEALDYVTTRNEQETVAKEQANLLAEEASALAEAAHSLATLSRG